MTAVFGKYFVHRYKTLKTQYKATGQPDSRSRLCSTRMQRGTEFCCSSSVHVLGHNWDDEQSISRHSLQYTEKTFLVELHISFDICEILTSKMVKITCE